jgi:hypothetical protein
MINYGDLINAVGFAFDETEAHAMAIAFDSQRLVAAGGVIENTVERSWIRPVAYRGSIKGYLVQIEKRDTDCVGQHWPVRS